MERHPVVSTNLRSIGFDPSTHMLEVEFVDSGAIYQYFMVPKSVYAELMAAESIGEFFNHHIKDRFGFRKL